MCVESSETSVNIYQPTRYNILEDGDLQQDTGNELRFHAGRIESGGT